MKNTATLNTKERFMWEYRIVAFFGSLFLDLLISKFSHSFENIYIFKEELSWEVETTDWRVLSATEMVLPGISSWDALAKHLWTYLKLLMLKSPTKI